MFFASLSSLCALFFFPEDETIEKGASTGAATLERNTRQKRDAKPEQTPPKMKKIKVSQEQIHAYDKYVIHGRKYKRKKAKNATP